MFKQFFSISLFLITLAACKNSPSPTAAPTPKIPQTGVRSIDSLSGLIFKSPKDANLYFQRARAFDAHPAQGGYDYAITDMKYALTLDSANLQYHYFLADVYMRYAQSRLALNVLERAAALHPDSTGALLKLAEYQLIVRQNGESLQTLNQALKLDPQNARAYFLLGQNFKQTGDTARAINSFQKAADFDSDLTDAFIELGMLFDRRHSPLALRYLDNALSRDSLNPQALFAKAVYFQNHRRDSEADDLYLKITQVAPHFADAWFNRGVLYWGGGAVDSAFHYLTRCIEEKPAYYKAYYYRGLIEEKRGDPKAALEDYHQSAGLAPSYEKAREAEARLQKTR